MKKFNKVVTDVETSIDKMIKEVEKPFKGILEFVKKHKKFILTLGVIYFVFNYLFSNDDEVEESEE